MPSPDTNQSDVVLVVDDEAEICETVQSVLGLMGVASVCFADAETALESVSAGRSGRGLLRCRNGKPDRRVLGALVDLNLPKLSGIEFGERLRSRGIDIPLALMTAAMLDADMGARLTQLKAHLLRKPFELMDMQDVVAGFLGERPS